MHENPCKNCPFELYQIHGILPYYRDENVNNCRICPNNRVADSSIWNISLNPREYYTSINGCEIHSVWDEFEYMPM